MHEAGIRGVRVNLETAGESDPDVARRNLAAAVERVAPLGWHVQVYTGLSVVAALADDVMKLPVPIVFDHFGGAQAAGGVEQPGFAALLALVARGQCLRQDLRPLPQLGRRRRPIADVAPLARALIAANPDRIVWGTDWPHPAHAALAGQGARRDRAVLRHRRRARAEPACAAGRPTRRSAARSSSTTRRGSTTSERSCMHPGIRGRRDG